MYIFTYLYKGKVIRLSRWYIKQRKTIDYYYLKIHSRLKLYTFLQIGKDKIMVDYGQIEWHKLRTPVNTSSKTVSLDNKNKNGLPSTSFYYLSQYSLSLSKKIDGI